VRQCLALLGVSILLVSCSGAKQQPPAAPHAVVQLDDGKTVSGVVKASSPAEMVVAGDDGVERKIPMSQVRSVSYEPAAGGPNAATAAAPGSAPAPPPTVTYEAPAGTAVAVRVAQSIDSATAAEGQTYPVEVAGDVRDAGGHLVIPSGSAGLVVINSASRGGRFKGQSDLVLSLQSVTVAGSPYAVNSTTVAEVGKQGMGKNKRTAKFAGGGAALGAIVGAIAGGGKGAAIGAGVGAGGGLVAQAATKGPSIRVPAESVLTFRLEQPLRVTVQQ
jgi:hypothetical protein